MNRSYWEKIAPSYNEEIFDVFRNDQKGIIRSAIKKLSSSKKSVIDIGCAVGKWIPFLASSFHQVIATDISAKNLAIAKENCKAYTNILYRRADMSNAGVRFVPSDVAVCINAILTDSLKKRTVFFKSLARCVRKDGHLVLVVPSLESAMYTGIIRNQWQIDKSISAKKIKREEAIGKLNNMVAGNIEIDGYATKHYLSEELELLLGREGFEIAKIRKVEYSWATEFVRSPTWLKAPYPWDWLCVAQRIA